MQSGCSPVRWWNMKIRPPQDAQCGKPVNKQTPISPEMVWYSINHPKFSFFPTSPRKTYVIECWCYALSYWLCRGQLCQYLRGFGVRCLALPCFPPHPPWCTSQIPRGSAHAIPTSPDRGPSSSPRVVNYGEFIRAICGMKLIWTAAFSWLESAGNLLVRISTSKGAGSNEQLKWNHDQDLWCCMHFNPSLIGANSRFNSLCCRSIAKERTLGLIICCWVVWDWAGCIHLRGIKSGVKS